ncbi:MAG TPA: peptide deformylase [Syntrophomonas sp.]|nr:peptide deformylase [Syntrophomonas sp.]HCF71685.1 peptide deformylase [Syntrophomonas sp.]
MSVYDVVTVPDNLLRAKANPVPRINEGVKRLLDNMRDTLYAFDGVGLAAPQIGVSKRIVVVDVGDNLIEMINPEIISSQGEQTAQEGCLSLPEVVGTVTRAQKVTVRFLNREGEEMEMEGENLLARAFQHEIDHLDGILFTDKAVDIKTVKER